MKASYIKSIIGGISQSRFLVAAPVCAACLSLTTGSNAALITDFGTNNVTVSGGYNTSGGSTATLTESATTWTIAAPAGAPDNNGRGITVPSISWGAALATDFATISIRLVPGNTATSIFFETFDSSFGSFKQFTFDLTGANTSTFTTLTSTAIGPIPTNPIGVFQIFKFPQAEVLGVEIASFGTIPEPSTALVSALGFAALLTGRRRRLAN